MSGRVCRALAKRRICTLGIHPWQRSWQGSGADHRASNPSAAAARVDTSVASTFDHRRIHMSLYSELRKPLLHSPMFYRALWTLTCIRHPGLVRRSSEYWRKTRGSLRGRRGFVIGNGPSLQIGDLERIADDVTIASNKCYLAFPLTRWRPTFLTCSDKLLWQKISLELSGKVDRVHVLSSIDVSGSPVEAVIFRHLGGHRSDPVGFSFDTSRGHYAGRTVTYHNLQLAVHLGLDPIYMIGCDHYYQGEEQHPDKDKPIMHRGQRNHFIDGYRQPGEKVNAAPISEMTAAFQVAARACAARGIRIFNATRGGYLEAFPRVDFDSIVS
jgi:hypothetical protein